MTNEAPAEGSLGLRLKEAREYRGLSQDDVAQNIGVSRSAISLMESGGRNVSAIELGRLAKLYKVTMESLAGHDSSDESVRMMARATATLSEEDRKEVLRFAEFLRARSVNEQA